MARSSEWFLFDFFQALRQETDMDLELSQYWTFLQCFNFHGPEHKEDVLFLCKTLWLQKNKYDREFDQIFERSYNKIMPVQPSLVTPVADPPQVKVGKVEDGVKVPEEGGARTRTIEKDPGPLPISEPQPEPGQATRDLNIRISNAGGGSETELDQGDPAGNQFVLSEFKYLPFDARAMQHSLRKVKTGMSYDLTGELDIRAITSQKGKFRIITELRYKRKRTGKRKVIWLSDHGGSMSPFAYWDNKLFEIVDNERNTEKVERYFFHNFPAESEVVENENSRKDYLLFSNRSLSVSRQLSKILHKIDKDTIVMIFSDGGAARKIPDEQRIDIFDEILQMIRGKTRYVGWINPVKNIDKSPAKYISFLVKMVYSSNHGVQKLLMAMKNGSV